MKKWLSWQRLNWYGLNQHTVVFLGKCYAKDFWNAYRPFLHSKKSKQANDIILKENEAVITDKNKIADLFNEYFIHIVDHISELSEHDFGTEFSEHSSINAIHEYNNERGFSSYFSFNFTNKSQVEQLLLNINTRKTCGHDSIPPRLLKESASAIAGPLATIVNDSIRQCRYPARWKMGQVTPIFKKDDELSKINYRPITVLPALNNIFEKLLSAQLEEYYTEILSHLISAYRRNYSCETSLIKLTEDWRRSLDNKKIVCVVSMDLSKAFDTIPHALWIAKLKAYGVNENSCALLSSRNF